MSHIACWWPSGPELVPTSTPGDTVNLLAFKAPPSGLYLPVPAGGCGRARLSTPGHLFTFLLAAVSRPTAQDWGVSVLTFGFQGNLPNHRLWNKKGRDVSYVSSWSTSDMAVTTAHLKGDMSEERPGDRNITVGPHFRAMAGSPKAGIWDPPARALK